MVDEGSNTCDFQSGIAKRPRLSGPDANNNSDGVPTLHYLFDRNSKESVIKSCARSSDDDESGQIGLRRTRQDETDSDRNDDGDDETPGYDGILEEPSIVPPVSSDESSIIPYLQYPPIRGVNRDSKSSTEDSDNSDTGPELKKRWQTFYKRDKKQPAANTDSTEGSDNMILHVCLLMYVYVCQCVPDYIYIHLSDSVSLSVCLCRTASVFQSMQSKTGQIGQNKTEQDNQRQNRAGQGEVVQDKSNHAKSSGDVSGYGGSTSCHVLSCPTLPCRY